MCHLRGLRQCWLPGPLQQACKPGGLLPTGGLLCILTAWHSEQVVAMIAIKMASHKICKLSLATAPPLQTNNFLGLLVASTMSAPRCSGWQQGLL